MSAVLPWQNEALEQIQSALDQERLPNAIGLVCPQGWGLTELSERVVQIIAELSEDQIASQVAHQDVRWIEPDGAVLKIDQIRRVNDFTVQTVQVAPRKVVLLLHADRLNANAANALLKTLEEPPKNTHIILATESWGKLLPTLRSRCQRVVVRPNLQAALEWLTASGHDVNDARFAEAGYAPFSYSEQAQLLKQTLGKMDSAAVSQLMKDDEIDTVELLGRWYRDLIERVSESLAAGNQARAEEFVSFADRLLDVRRQIISSNAANQMLLFEELMQRYRKLV